MRVGVIGINHKLADLQLRERLAQVGQRCFMPGSFHGDHIFILLSTCNRTEVYFSSDDLAGTHSYLLHVLREGVAEEDFDQKVYSYFGFDCFLHLARVTAGLDSAIIAETEIQGQVKSAYEHAAACMTLPRELHYLFQKALKIGKKVRTELPMGRGMPDLEHAVFNAGKHFFTDPAETKVLFVGASDVNCKILSFLKSKQLTTITLCNRSLEHAKEISTVHQTHVMEWKHLARWHLYDWVIFGTKSPHPLVKGLPEECVGRKLIIDLCVPRNVDPKVGRDARVTLLNIDQINRILRVRKQQISHLLTQAEDLIATTATRYLSRYQKPLKIVSE